MDKETLAYIKEHQEYVKQKIDRAFQNPTEKFWKGADVFVAFKIPQMEFCSSYKVFIGDNWNDRRISLFRGFFAGWFHNGISHEIAFIGDLEVVHQWDDDQNYVFIRNTRTNDIYYISWYKSRGTTQVFLCNGKNITLSQFRKLLEEMIKPIREEII